MVNSQHVAGVGSGKGLAHELIYCRIKQLRIGGRGKMGFSREDRQVRFLEILVYLQRMFFPDDVPVSGHYQCRY